MNDYAIVVDYGHGGRGAWQSASGDRAPARSDTPWGEVLRRVGGSAGLPRIPLNLRHDILEAL